MKVYEVMRLLAQFEPLSDVRVTGVVWDNAKNRLKGDYSSIGDFDFDLAPPEPGKTTIVQIKTRGRYVRPGHDVKDPTRKQQRGPRKGAATKVSEETASV